MSRLKKFNSLLNDITIVNFPLLWVLIKRYYLLSLMIPIIITMFAAYFYITQNKLFLTTSYFTNKASRENLASNSIADLVGEKKIGLSEEDVIAFKNDWTFNKLLAKIIYSHPEFYSMNFNAIKSREQLSARQMFETCKHNQECISRSLQAILPSFYNIVSGATTGKYVVRVVTLERKTSKILVNNISNLIEKVRITALKTQFNKQYILTKKLIEKKMKEISSKDGIELNKQATQLNYKLIELRERMNFTLKHLTEDRLKLETLKLQLAESDRSVLKKVSISDSSRIKNEKYEKLIFEITNLRKNINLLSQNSKISETETQVLKKLKLDLEQKTIQFKKLYKVEKRSISGIDNFVNKQDKMVNFIEYEYKIYKDKVKKQSFEQKIIKKQFDTIIEKKSEIDASLSALGPDLEHLSLLKKKAVTLKLMLSTITSDLVFDSINDITRPIQTTTLSKFIFFTMILAFFSVFIVIFLRYLFDQKIYTEDDIYVFFSGIEIIGNTPEFE